MQILATPRSLSITCLVTAATLANGVADADPARPTTQACLGDLDTMLACAPGTTRSGTECRAKSDHWSGSSRRGPSVYLRDPAGRRVLFAANYEAHKKTGRAFWFDDEGRLASWTDYRSDLEHGLSVTCTSAGRAAYVAWFADGKPVGVARAWTLSTGSFASAFEFDARGRGHAIQISADQMRRPDELCRPRVCDVRAAPDLTGIPSAQR